jgi:SnoaL-like domain
MPEAGTGVDPDRLIIRDLIENWAIWRDPLIWDRFSTVWHEDGRMMATWFQGTADEFVEVSRDGYERGVPILHFLGGMSIDIAGTRAIAQSKMTISQGAPVEASSATWSAPAAFTICWKSRTAAGAWCCASRSRRRTGSIRSIPACGSNSMRSCSSSFYLQTKIGYKVKPDMPGLDGPEVERLYNDGAAWLAGESLRR